MKHKLPPFDLLFHFCFINYSIISGMRQRMSERKKNKNENNLKNAK